MTCLSHSIPSSSRCYLYGKKKKKKKKQEETRNCDAHIMMSNEKQEHKSYNSAEMVLIQ